MITDNLQRFTDLRVTAEKALASLKAVTQTLGSSPAGLDGLIRETREAHSVLSHTLRKIFDDLESGLPPADLVAAAWYELKANYGPTPDGPLGRCDQLLQKAIKLLQKEQR